MKLSFLYSMVYLCALTACSGISGRYVIEGTAPEELEGKYVYMLRNGNFRYGESNKACDSALVENGRFVFTGRVTGDSVRFLLSGKNTLNFILEPGKLTLDIQDQHSLRGTPRNEDFMKFLGITEAMYKNVGELRADKTLSKETQDKMVRQSRDETRQQYKALIEANKESAFGEYVLYELLQSFQTVEEFDEAYALVGCRKVGYRPLQGAISRFEELRLTQPGKMFTDFTVERGNLDGTPASLSDYVGKGKYVLVDFWASWCGWCRAEFPVLKEVYAKYKGDRFEMVGIVVNDKEEKTLKAMKDDGVTWPQIINAGKEPMFIYGINGIPEIILFAPDGKILARGLRGDKLKVTVADALNRH